MYVGLDPDSLRDYDMEVTPLDVTAELSIYVRDRLVVTATGVPTTVSEHDEEVSGLVVLKFPVTELRSDVFPSFVPTELPDSVTPMPGLWIPVGWAVTGLLLTAAVGAAVTRSPRRAERL